jgi:uncharacterized cupredoxin-like copper-binding protein
MRVVGAGRAAGMVLVIAGSALLLACGGGGESASSSGAKSGGASAAGGPLSVALSEWSVKPASASVAAGKVTMKVTNSGATPHELMIVKTDTAHDKLEEGAGVADETKYPPLARTKQLNNGQSEDLTADLTPGKYVLLCNVSGHYDLGMHTAFSVN